jgi:hypothetical protein
LKISEGNVTLKCSFGTSKYCANFLSNAFCDSQTEGKCPFIHYLERKRDKVVQDDVEFRDFLQVQDQIASEFCRSVGIKEESSIKSELWSLKHGLPGPLCLFNLPYSVILGKAHANQKDLDHIRLSSGCSIFPESKFYKIQSPRYLKAI